MPKPISIEQINAMSEKEVQALNAKLGRQVVINFGAKMVLKWALIFGAVHVAKKFVEVKYPVQSEKTDGGN